MKFNPFFLKYLLSEDLPAHIKNNSNVTNVRFDATSNVEDPKKFFTNLTSGDYDSYAKFAEEAIRCEIDRDVFYVFFRNAKEDRPDIGTGRYTFARPSSVEIGSVDANGAYVSFYKEHYSTWFTNTTNLDAPTKNELNLLTKSIEYAIINTIVRQFNANHGTNIPLKPVDANGRAVFTKVQTQSSAAGTTDPTIMNIAQNI